jgi:hypothetical protein
MTAHTTDVTFHDDGLGGLNAYRGPKLIGRASPWVAGEPGGDWYARRLGRKNQPAQRCKSRQEALDYLAETKP